MVYYNNSFSGHVSTVFTNNIGTKKTFISYFHSSVRDSYQWAFIEDIENRTDLLADDFSNDQVVKGVFQINGTFANPLFEIRGYESQEHYFASYGHQLYKDYLSYDLGNRNYYYPDIFEYITYAGQVANYTWEGSGLPPEEINVPGSSVDYSFENNTIFFQAFQIMRWVG